MKSISNLVRLTALALAVASVVQELRKPASQRTWHGYVAGFVSYDWRLLTADRFQAAWWNPRERQLLVPMPFGVGWTVNVYALVELVRTAMEPS